MIKKAIPVIMTAVLLFNLFGYYFVFRTEQGWIREEMKGLIRSRNFESSTCEKLTIRVSDPDLKWLEDDEFLFHGVMYDVVSIIRSNGNLIITCINDSRESTLVAGFHKANDLAGTVTSTEKSKTRISLLYHLIKFAITKEKTQLIMREYLSAKVTHTDDVFYDHYSPPLSPPPKG